MGQQGHRPAAAGKLHCRIGQLSREAGALSAITLVLLAITWLHPPIPLKQMTLQCCRTTHATMGMLRTLY